MAQEVLIKTIFQVKRGLSEAWNRVNPILRVGEPGYEIDTCSLKVGNGIDNWKTLPYIGGKNAGLNYCGSVATVANLPEIGNSGDIWQVTQTNQLYIWNTQLNTWEPFNLIDLSGYLTKKELEDGTYQLKVDRIECGSSNNL